MKQLCIILGILSTIGCKTQNDLDLQGFPKKIVIAVYGGSGDNSGSIRQAMVPFKKYLAKKFNREVEFYISSDYTGIIEAIHTKKAHIAYLSPFSYVIAAQRKDIIPLVVVGQDGKPSLYHSVIFCNAKSGIHTIQELKNKSKALSIGFADPASTSGHLIPRAYLNSKGLNPDSAFKQVLFGGSHMATILTVASGKVDVGCSTVEYGINILERKGLLKKEELNILWTSDAIVGSPIVIRNDLSQTFIKQVKDLYLNLAKDAPEAFLPYIKIYHANPETLSYITVSDTTYNGIRKIAGSVKDLNLFN